MARKRYTINENTKPTPEQLQMLRNAAAMQPVFDDDSPELTDEQLADFKRVHEIRQTERRKQNVTLRLSPKTIARAKSLGKGYTGILSRIIETTLDDPSALSKFL